MVAIVAAADAENALATLRACGETAAIIGHVRAGHGDVVIE